MLVLTRRAGESIRIGDDVSVRVLDIQGGQVRLAIDAPREIPVHREEIWRVVQEENQQAARLGPEADPGALWRRTRDGKGNKR